MTPKFSILFLLVTLHFLINGQVSKSSIFVNPTGSYKLDSRTTEKHGETFGYFGAADVKLLDSSTIAVSFFVCKGAPSYSSGSFVDTLQYSENKAIHRTSDDDTSCRITFAFTNKGMTVDQYQADLNFGCAFGHGVFADGFYKRISTKVPIIEDMEDKRTTNLFPKH